MWYRAGSNFPPTMTFICRTTRFDTPENNDYDENFVERTEMCVVKINKKYQYFFPVHVKNYPVNKQAVWLVQDMLFGSGLPVLTRLTMQSHIWHWAYNGVLLETDKMALSLGSFVPRKLLQKWEDLQGLASCCRNLWKENCTASLISNTRSDSWEEACLLQCCKLPSALFPHSRPAGLPQTRNRKGRRYLQGPLAGMRWPWTLTMSVRTDLSSRTAEK